MNFQSYLSSISTLLKDKEGIENLRSDKITEILKNLLLIIKEGSKYQGKRALSYMEEINQRSLKSK